MQVPIGVSTPRIPAQSLPEVPHPLPERVHEADSFYTDQQLGAVYTPEATTLRVFAPTAKQVKVHVYDAPEGGAARVEELQRHEDGTWDKQLTGDCNGKFYTYSADGDGPGFHPEQEYVDPYSKCVTAWNGRTMIVHDTTPMQPRPSFPADQAVIYEVHVRDFTADPNSGVSREAAGKYPGMTQSGTHLPGHPEVSTGLDHIKELGANTAQIMPFTAFACDKNQYGWGYDQVGLWMAPATNYASQPGAATPVRETKEMINHLHENGIRVVMDLVLHTDPRAHALEGLVPGFYYRQRPDGSHYNGTGCGPELRSEAPMVRRLILDTAKSWAQEYKIDGFRVDLMGLVDRKTMAEVAESLHSADPNLLLYGEPWTCCETSIQPTGKGSQKGLEEGQRFGFFNDDFRDAKGSVFSAKGQGFIENGSGIDKVKETIMGSINTSTDGPTESINFLECHDNATLGDKLVLSTQDDPSISDADRWKMGKLGAALLLTSQGIPFIQSGQEWWRSKGNCENSYNQGDEVNMLRWEQKLEHADLVGYYEGLIALRKEHPMFHLSSAEQVRESLHFLDSPDKSVAYTLTDPTGKDPWKRATVVLNAAATAQELSIPEGNWQVMVDGERAGDLALADSAVKLLGGNRIQVPARTAVVLGESRSNG